jgi:nucleoside-diphosphate-sugar epimerase
MTPANAT